MDIEYIDYDGQVENFTKVTDYVVDVSNGVLALYRPDGLMLRNLDSMLFFIAHKPNKAVRKERFASETTLLPPNANGKRILVKDKKGIQYEWQDASLILQLISEDRNYCFNLMYVESFFAETQAEPDAVASLDD